MLNNNQRGVLSFQNDLNSLKHSRDLRQNEGYSQSPSSRRRLARPADANSQQNSLHKQRITLPSETQINIIQHIKDTNETPQSNQKKSRITIKNVQFDKVTTLPHSPYHSWVDNSNFQQPTNSYVIDSANRMNQDKQIDAKNQHTSISPVSTSTPLKAININNSNFSIRNESIPDNAFVSIKND